MYWKQRRKNHFNLATTDGVGLMQCRIRWSHIWLKIHNSTRFSIVRGFFWGEWQRSTGRQTIKLCCHLLPLWQFIIWPDNFLRARHTVSEHFIFQFPVFWARFDRHMCSFCFRALVMHFLKGKKFKCRLS